MIFDHISNARVYAGIDPRIRRALEYLGETDLDALQPGRYELEGPDLCVIVSEYSTKQPAGGRWEAHRRFIDLQYLVRGTERVGYAPVERLQAGPDDDQKDVMWLSGSGQFASLQPGDFMILWPHDAHMPGMAIDSPAPVRKIVVKIAARQA